MRGGSARWRRWGVENKNNNTTSLFEPEGSSEPERPNPSSTEEGRKNPH